MNENVKFVDSWLIFKDIKSTKNATTHRLCDIYKHLFRQEYAELHNAENDCKCLLLCIMKVQKEFFENIRSRWKECDQITL